MTLDRILSISAFIVSLIALVFTGLQSYWTYHHNRISVRPKIDWRIDTNTPEHGLLDFRLVNVGLGPAIIKDILLVFDREIIGRVGSESCSKVDLLLGIEEIEPEYSYCWILNEEEEIYLREDEEITLYKVDIEDENEPHVPETVFKKLGLHVEYCDMYDYCWILDP